MARVGNSDRLVYVEAQAIVVASGSLMTPPLLLNSGLRNPNIGKGLHLHPVVFMWGYFPEESGPAGTCYEGAIMTSYSPIWKKGSSAPVALLEVPSMHPGSFATFQPWTSGKSSDNESWEITIIFEITGMGRINLVLLLGFGEIYPCGGIVDAAADFKERMARFSRTVTLCVVTRDESTGQVRVAADGTPAITYTLNAADEATALEGIEKGLRVLIAAGATEVGTHQQDGERFSLKGMHIPTIKPHFQNR